MHDEKDKAIHWKAEYSVEVEEIDTQHLELMSQINELINHSIQNLDEGKKMFKEKMEKAIKHCARHFETEEILLSKTDYKDFDAHKKEHKELLERVENMKGELRKAKDVKYLFNLTVCFKEWFLSHILLYDREAKEFFKAGAEAKRT